MTPQGTFEEAACLPPAAVSERKGRVGLNRPRFAGRHSAARGLSRPRRGFTIVEVLATMALMTIVLPVLTDAISVAIHCASDARHRTEAAALAESKLTEVISTGEWQTGSAMAGDFSPEYPNYQWTASIGDWTQSGLEQIDVQVTWTGRDGQRQIKLSSLVYNGVNAGNGNPGNGTGAATSGGGGGTGAKSGAGSGGSKGAGSGGGGAGGGAK